MLREVIIQGLLGRIDSDLLPSLGCRARISWHRRSRRGSSSKNMSKPPFSGPPLIFNHFHQEVLVLDWYEAGQILHRILEVGSQNDGFAAIQDSRARCVQDI